MSLLETLRTDAVSLGNELLPDDNELRVIVGALVSHVQDLEAKLIAKGVDLATPAPADDAAKAEAQAKLEAAQAALAEAQAAAAAAGVSDTPAPPESAPAA